MPLLRTWKFYLTDWRLNHFKNEINVYTYKISDLFNTKLNETGFKSAMHWFCAYCASLAIFRPLLSLEAKALVVGVVAVITLYKFWFL